LLDWCCRDKQSARPPFDQWIAAFRAQALAHGITDEIYARVMSAVNADTTGLEVSRSRPEFTIQLWQYLNRATSDWKIAAGREKAQQYAQLLTHIESDFGVEPSFMLHLGDRCVGGEPFVQQFPGSERAPTLAEVQEIQRRLTALGFDTGGADGRIGTGTAIAVRNYQLKVDLEPADRYAGIKLLARLRQGA